MVCRPVCVGPVREAAIAQTSMQNQFSRTQLLLGRPAMDTLAGSRVAVFGVGGVGGYAVEVLARSGVGAIDVFDDDRICLTNVNRQVIALTSNIGRYKVDVVEERIHAINPQCIVRKHQMFYLVGNADQVDLSVYDYVVDCIDTVSAKMELIRRCKRLGVPIICSMGAANKLDATAFRVADITKTMMDPLAKVIRKRLRREGINHFKCVYSPEVPLEPFDDEAISCRFHCICPDKDMRKCTERRNIPASNAWVPAAAGLIVGGEVVKDLIEMAGTMRIAPDQIDGNEAAALALARAQKMHEQAVADLKRRREAAALRKNML